jgi:NitT/TauT family transport system permease protein
MILLFLDDLEDVPEEYFHIAYSLNYSRWDIWRMKLSATGPNLYNNCRITMGWCWTYLVIAELVASQAGVGYVVKEAQRFSKTPEIYVGIVTLGFIGLFSDSLWKYFYPKVFKYKAL